MIRSRRRGIIARKKAAGPGIAFRSLASVATSTTVNTVVSAPPGAVNGSDYIVVGIDAGAAAAVAITPPSGWVQIGTVQYSAADPWYVNTYLFGRVHDGASSWTFLHSSASSGAAAEAWSGVDLSNPIDVAAATATATTVTTITAPALTIATPGAQSIIARGSWDGNAITPPAGWTERLDQAVLWLGDKNNAAIGSTGTVAVPSGNAIVASPAGVIHAALRPA